MNKFIFMTVIVFFTYGCSAIKRTSDTYFNEVHHVGCLDKTNTANSPWNISNLYDCESKEIFIPYQLWSGAQWDGNKQTHCIH